MADTQSRKWQVTFNNPEEHGWTHDSIKSALSGVKNLSYWCMCDEVGAKGGTYHTHLFLYRENPFRFSRVQRLFPGAHLEMARGTCRENRDYIRKEGKHGNSGKSETNLKDTFEEFGECPLEEQGRRTDLEGLYAMVKEGMSDYEILEENPAFMKRLGDVARCREVIRSEQFRNVFREMHVEYWHGEPGAGKSSGILVRYGFGNVYRVTSRLNPWDGYRGQDVVLFEELCDCFEATEMLVWLDGYPLELPCRYANRTACYTKVFFTSNRPLEDQYFWLQREQPGVWRAFLRRIHCVKEFGRDGIREYTDMGDFLQRFRPLPPGSPTPFGRA